MDAPTSLPAPRRGLEAKRQQLVRNRRRATACLVVASLAFVLVTVLGRGTDGLWVGYAQATAEAAMVGGLADWFAVVALFRHPLGIPIPHTAVVPERKEQFAATLGDFVQESFLTPDVIVGRVRAAGLGGRLATWLADPGNASRAAGLAAQAGAAALDLVEDDAVHRAADELIRARVAALPVAPMAGRALAAAIDGGRHHAVLDSALRGLDRALEEHREELRRRVGEQAPWWLPGAVEDRIFDRLLDGARALLAEVASDPTHELRLELDRRLAMLAADLQSSPDMAARGRLLVDELLDRADVRRWVADVWVEAKASIRAQAADPASDLRTRAAGAVAAAGRRLQHDPELAARVDAGAEAAARFVAEQLGDEVGALITGTIARWDAHETSDRLELLLGPDLQFIRINGTIVGGLAGLALHGVAALLG